MRGLIKLVPVNAKLNIEIKLEKSGDVYYRIAGKKEWVYTNHTIMESVHNYYVARKGDRPGKVMQGTKRECLNEITNLIRTVITLCQGRY